MRKLNEWLNKLVKINYTVEGNDKYTTGKLIGENEEYVLIKGLKGDTLRIYHSAIKLMKVVE